MKKLILLSFIMSSSAFGQIVRINPSVAAPGVYLVPPAISFNNANAAPNIINVPGANNDAIASGVITPGINPNGVSPIINGSINGVTAINPINRPSSNPQEALKKDPPIMSNREEVVTKEVFIPKVEPSYRDTNNANLRHWNTASQREIEEKAQQQLEYKYKQFLKQ